MKKMIYSAIFMVSALVCPLPLLKSVTTLDTVIVTIIFQILRLSTTGVLTALKYRAIASIMTPTEAVGHQGSRAGSLCAAFIMGVKVV